MVAREMKVEIHESQYSITTCLPFLFEYLSRTSTRASFMSFLMFFSSLNNTNSWIYLYTHKRLSFSLVNLPTNVHHCPVLYHPLGDTLPFFPHTVLYVHGLVFMAPISTRSREGHVEMGQNSRRQPLLQLLSAR